jgi:peptide/nickel transport system substrate-binding protein
MMKLGRKTGSVVAALALVAGVVAAVPSASAASSFVGPAPAVKGAVKGGTLNIFNQSDYEHIDPARNYVGGTLDFYRFFTRSLLNYRTFEGKTELLPDLAADLGTSSNNSKTWTFKLRTNVKWEDGSKITCADIKYGTMRTYADDILTGGTTYAKDFLENPNGYTGPYKQPTADLPSIVCSAKGDSITYKLSQPVPYFQSIVAFGAFAPVKKSKDTKEKYDLRPLSSGPYKVDKYNRGKDLTLVRNAQWDAKTDPTRWNYPDKIVVKFGSDQAVIENGLISDSGAYKTGMSMDTELVANLSKVVGNAAYKSRFLQYQSIYSRHYLINMDTVKDLNVRKAIQCAIDYNTVILAAGGSNVGSPSNSMIPSSLSNAYRKFNICGRDTAKSPEAQVTAAKDFLSKATTKPSKLTVAFRDKGTEKARAAAVGAALEAVGFNVVLKEYPTATYYTAIGVRDANEPDVIQGSWGYDWAAATGIILALLDGRTMSATDAKSNYSRQNDTAIQALFAATDLMTDVKKSDKALGDIEQKAIQDLATVVPVYMQIANSIFGSKVGGIQQDGGYGTTSAAAAYIKK